MSHPKQPLTVTEAAHACGFGQRWARQLVHRYTAKGPDKYYDQRRHNPGQDSLLTKRQQAALKRAIMRGHTKDGSLWTNVTVRDWIEEKTGRRPNETTGLNYLRILGFTVLSPRPRHTQAATAAEAAAFKKSSTGVSGS
jgi:transposase